MTSESTVFTSIYAFNSFLTDIYLCGVEAGDNHGDLDPEDALEFYQEKISEIETGRAVSQFLMRSMEARLDAPIGEAHDPENLISLPAMTALADCIDRAFGSGMEAFEEDGLLAAEEMHFGKIIACRIFHAIVSLHSALSKAPGARRARATRALMT